MLESISNFLFSASNMMLNLFLYSASIIFILTVFLDELIPFIYRPLVKIFSVVVIGISLYNLGLQSKEMEWMEKYNEVLKQRQTVTEKIIPEYKTITKTIKGKTNVIIKEIPKYITKEVNANCNIPNAFVGMHDAAANNEVPETTRDSDVGTPTFEGTTKQTDLRTVLETVTENYETCNLTRAQLKMLQWWIKEQQKIELTCE